MSSKRNGEARKGGKQSDYCFFCETHVINFARHITRNHNSETEVQRIMSLPPGNKERQKLLADLRKRGNYLFSTIEEKAVKHSKVHIQVLPCDNCLGFYSIKYLWRHRRRCLNIIERRNHRAAGQNVLLKNLRVDKQLKETVFPRMRSDNISLTAKTDSLICAFGARYIKIHREKHFILVASRKMREMAKLLIELRKLDSSINQLFDALKPKYFDLLIRAVKTVAKYNIEKDCYKSPTYALNAGTMLKQCCDIAIYFALKKADVSNTIDSAEAEAEIKSLLLLIEGNWRFEISSQAASDLNLNKWNKVTIVPLASDLRLLKAHLIEKANSAITALEKEGTSQESYKVLLETVFCRVILLNRRRPGEVQRILKHTYESSSNNDDTYEEFSSVISLSEKVLLKHFKRLVIRGKRGRGVPVFFSKDVQHHIKVLLKFREKFVPKANTFLFGNIKTNEPVCGYKIIKKYAESCGAKNPTALSCTRLRKHLATLSQIFAMSDSDVERLATFMGHTLDVHRSSYRLPDDVYQTAKLSKLLLLMEKGEAEKYTGKTLDEIDINLEDNLMDDVYEHDGVEDMVINQTAQSPDSSILPQKCSEKTKRILVPWTTDQKTAVKDFFKKHILKKIPPKKDECLKVRELNKPLLENKDWLKIKVFVQNEYKKKKK